jgi:dihydroorotate dehydrogenase
MGFNNQGLERIVANLKKKRRSLIVGGNIGKNKLTPNENATEDYIKCFDALFDHVDYFVVNVSSPNTPGLRNLQHKEPLSELLSRLQETNNSKKYRKPILLKIAPDLSEAQLDDIIEIVRKVKLDGLVTTNTTVSREHLQTSASCIKKAGEGGLSGKPLRERSNEIIRYLRKKLDKNVVIIGVGGVIRPEDALEKFRAGADLIQIYTGFIYEGPGIVKSIHQSMIHEAEKGK